MQRKWTSALLRTSLRTLNACEKTLRPSRLRGGLLANIIAAFLKKTRAKADDENEVLARHGDLFLRSERMLPALGAQDIATDGEEHAKRDQTVSGRRVRAQEQSP